MKRFALVLLLVGACSKDSPSESKPGTTPEGSTAADTTGKTGAKPTRARPAMPDLKVPRNRATQPDGDNTGAAPAVAQTPEEAKDREAAKAVRRAERNERMMNRFDIDGDGKLTVEELGKATGRMKFDDPAAVDTDHDGVISSEELQAAMKARRESRPHGQGRHLRGDGAAQPPADDPAPAQ